MGLIKAAMGSFSGTLGDQWKEFFYCDSMPSHVLVTKGAKRVNKKEVPTPTEVTTSSQTVLSLQSMKANV